MISGSFCEEYIRDWLGQACQAQDYVRFRSMLAGGEEVEETEPGRRGMCTEQVSPPRPAVPASPGAAGS